MFTIEFAKDNENDLDSVRQLLSEFSDIEILEVDSLELETIIQILIPVSTVIAPIISALFNKLFKNKKITIKHNDIEVTADSFEEAKKVIANLTDEQ